MTKMANTMLRIVICVRIFGKNNTIQLLFSRKILKCSPSNGERSMGK